MDLVYKAPENAGQPLESKVMIKYLTELPEETRRKYLDAGWKQEKGDEHDGKSPWESFENPDRTRMDYYSVIDGYLHRMSFNPNQKVNLMIKEKS